ncbi:MAG: 2-oxoglutarate dehydrogenase, partial [Ignavibacteriaceae bacterium]|nr:2-oxoglutarate dehydrogenase [Ignavibacteriaceae bacterium]
MNIIMPKMGESINEGTIIKWHKSVGDAVKMDEIIFEISTDKVDTEIPSPVEGVMKEIKYNEGDTVEVGTVVAVIDSNGEAVQNTDIVITESHNENETSKEQKLDAAAEFIDIEMPKMGESVMEGTIIKWYKRVGDKIGKDETLFEISTDKVDTEVPSPVEGIIGEIL